MNSTSIPSEPIEIEISEREVFEQSVQLSGISWQTYERLLDELSDRRLYLTYYKSSLDIMVPSPEHELYKKLAGRFVETLAEELEIDIYPLGSTTFKQPKLLGVEPDECFYVRNLQSVRGKKRLEIGKDPAPDLVVAIDITSRSKNRMAIYAALGVSEVWCYDGKSLTLYRLQDRSPEQTPKQTPEQTPERQYDRTSESQIFPGIPIQEIERFLQQAMEKDYLDLVRSFRQWLRKYLLK